MTNEFRQNSILMLAVTSTLNTIVILAAIVAYFFWPSTAKNSKYDVIRCADAKGATHECIRIDPTAGEFTNQTNGATYKMIWGQ